MRVAPSVLTIQGLPIHLIPDYAQWLRERVAEGHGMHVVTLNAEMVMQAVRNPRLKTVIQQAELVVPDGVGVTLYLQLRRCGTYHAPGIDLVGQVLAHLRQETVFFLGGGTGSSGTGCSLLATTEPSFAGGRSATRLFYARGGIWDCSAIATATTTADSCGARSTPPGILDSTAPASVPSVSVGGRGRQF